MVKVIRSNTEIALTPPRVVQFRSYFVQIDNVTGDTLQMFKVKSQRSRLQDQKSRSQRKVMCQQQKRQWIGI